MKRKSITFKLFSITLVVFLVFIALALVVQGVFFERFYSERRANVINDSLTNFISTYNEKQWSYDEIRSDVKSFNDYNTSNMAIVTENRVYTNEKRYQFIIETAQGEQLVIYLNTMTDVKDFDKIKPKYFDEITVTGYKWSQGVKIFRPYSIAINDRVWFDYSEQFDNSKIETLTGSLIGFNVPTTEELQNGLVSKELGIALENYFENPVKEVLNLNEINKIEYTGILSNHIQTVYYAQVESEHRKQLVFVLSSNDLVVEAMQVLEDFYVYVFIGAFVVLILLSIAYSMMIANPLVKMNKVAMKMAALDFSQELDVASGDEMGSLANSLNMLSRNLNNSLLELKVANEQLTLDIERERELEILRKDFVSGISHELKTPLGIIRGYSEGLKDGIFDDEADYYFDIILDEVNRMDLLVMDMLELSKLESESFEINEDKFDIVQLIEFIRDKLVFQLAEKNLEIVIETSDNLPACYGDELKIEQVLVNFISNAIRHSIESGKIDIVCESKKGEMMCSIYNRGKTIPKEKHDKIWDKFYRVQESRAKKDGGTGLGLAIVKNILKHHKSQYGLVNMEDGVKFYFSLPFYKK